MPNTGGWMLSNYFRIAVRNITKNKGYSLINIAGLAIGLACFILITFYVTYELSYDNYHTDVDLIYRVATYDVDSGEEYITANTSAPVGPTILDEAPQVEYAARIMSLGLGPMKYENNVFYEDGRLFADQSFLDVFDVKFVQGDRKTALDQPWAVVMTESMALKYFGSENPVGQTMTGNFTYPLTVTGVISDQPGNTHLKYDFLVSLKSLEGRYPFDEWFLSNFKTYIKVRENADIAALEEYLKQMPASHVGEQLTEYNETLEYFLQPVAGIHLHSNLLSEAEPPGNITNIYIFISIGIFVLLIACLNYINLSTSRFSTRLKEVGIRKMIGAERSQLVYQFLIESALLVLIALTVSILLVELAFPLLNRIMEGQLHSTNFLNPRILLTIALVFVVVGLGSGLYPALALSWFKPASLIRKNTAAGNRDKILRRVLVSVQFTISIFLLSATLIAFQQLKYLRGYDTGLNLTGKIVLDLQGGANRQVGYNENYQSVKAEFLKNPDIRKASACSNFIGHSTGTFSTWRVEEGELNSHNVNYVYQDPDFLDNMNLKLSAGRWFREGEPYSDTLRNCVINSTAARVFGFTDEQTAVGQIIDNGRSQMKIVGVVRDFNYYGLQKQIEPLLMIYNPNMFNMLVLSVTTDNPREVLGYIENTWNTILPDAPFVYHYLDDVFVRQYNLEERTGKLLGGFAILGNFIALLGLYGLVSYTSERRKKEIGIRKVLGASISSLLKLLIQEIVLLVILANIIAVPLILLTMNNWLSNFAYRINLGWELFVMAGALALGFALLTVSWQVVRVSLTNPSKVLKYE